MATHAQVKQAHSCISKHKDYKYNSHIVLFVVMWVVAPNGVGPTHVAHPPLTDTRILARLSPLRAPQQRRTKQENKPEERGAKARAPFRLLREQQVRERTYCCKGSMTCCYAETHAELTRNSELLVALLLFTVNVGTALQTLPCRELSLVERPRD